LFESDILPFGFTAEKGDRYEQPDSLKGEIQIGGNLSLLREEGPETTHGKSGTFRVVENGAGDTHALTTPKTQNLFNTIRKEE